jgi:transketolase
MRDVFIGSLCQRMAENHQIFFLSADFGSPALDKLRSEFPHRFINVGVAEQNLINVAYGLALEGYTVYAYAIAPFITMRDYEQVRLHLAISSQIKPVNVNLIGVGAGISYDMSGPTHHCLEDLTIMRLLPHFTVFSPSDWKLAELFVDFSLGRKSSKYLRFDSKPLPVIYESVGDLDFEKGFHELIKGERVCLVSTGFMTHRALNAAKVVQNLGVIDVFILKPAKEELLFEALKQYEYIITLEEGFIGGGGLDSLIAKVLSDRHSIIKLKRLGFDDRYVFDLGDRNHLHKLNNLDEESIISAVKLWT